MTSIPWLIVIVLLVLAEVTVDGRGHIEWTGPKDRRKRQGIEQFFFLLT